MFRRNKLVIGLVVAISATLMAMGVVFAGPEACEERVNNTFDKLLECVTVEGVREHQAAFQAIADANGGLRVSGAPGYDRSVDYVVQRMQAAGYQVTVQPFQFQSSANLALPILEVVSPTPRQVTNNIMAYSGSGDVTAAVTTLAYPPADATPGCEAADFAGFPAGNIALISRGTCTFAIKATNAYNAGASGVIIYNNAPGVINGTLGNGFTLDIPVTSVTQAEGQQLAGTPGLVMRLKTDTFRGMATTYNVLAESRDGERNLPYKGTDFSGRSDYGPFIAQGIPSGGLFTGADGIKTAAEAAIWGGTAGVAYDPCYHQACDTYDNINLAAFDANSDAVAFSVLQYAMNTEEINGEKGKGNFKPDYWGDDLIQ